MRVAGQQAPARKLVIKPLKSAPKIPANFWDDMWAKLHAAVVAVHTKQPVQHSLEELYRAVEDLCLQNMGARLYEQLQRECERHIESRLQALVGQTPNSLAFLSLMERCWADHCQEMLTIRSVFLYLDRTYVMQARAALRPPTPPPPSPPHSTTPGHRLPLPDFETMHFLIVARLK